MYIHAVYLDVIAARFCAQLESHVQRERVCMEREGLHGERGSVFRERVCRLFLYLSFRAHFCAQGESLYTEGL